MPQETCECECILYDLEMAYDSLSSGHAAIVMDGGDDGLDGGGLGPHAEHVLLRRVVLDARRQPRRVADVVQPVVARQRLDALRDLFCKKRKKQFEGRRRGRGEWVILSPPDRPFVVNISN